MTRPQQYKAKLADAVKLNEDFTQYTFELVEPNQMEFGAGQYVSLDVENNNLRRSYSICSSPAVQHSFELLVDLTPAGPGSQFLQSLTNGQEVNLLAPMGHFTIDPAIQTELTFVATGSGIAPFRAFILDQLQNRHYQQKITMYWGMRYENRLFWLDEFEDLMQSFPNFKFHPVISKAGQEWPLCRGHVTDCLLTHGSPPTANYYLCGNAHMIRDVEQELLTAQVPQAQIHYEKFW